MHYHETQEHGTNYTRPPPQMIDGDQEFEVKRVMGHRLFGKGRKLQYLIKWQGYPKADNIWEPKELVFAPKLIGEPPGYPSIYFSRVFPEGKVCVVSKDCDWNVCCR